MKILIILMLLFPFVSSAEQKIQNTKDGTTNYVTDSLRWFIIMKTQENAKNIEVTNKDRIQLLGKDFCYISRESSTNDEILNRIGKNVRSKAAECTIQGRRFDLHSLCYENDKRKKECMSAEEAKLPGIKFYLKGF